MRVATTTTNTSSAGRFSLGDTIANLRSEFSHMKGELRDVNSENSRLRRELTQWRTRSRTPPNVRLDSVRRKAAFYCHPDRGGDAILMSNLNVLFDFLESSQRLFLEMADGGIAA